VEDVGIDLDPFRFHVNNEESYDRSIEFMGSSNWRFRFRFRRIGKVQEGDTQLIATFEWLREASSVWSSRLSEGLAESGWLVLFMCGGMACLFAGRMNIPNPKWAAASHVICHRFFRVR
jgi:hypothetical protein